MNVLFSIVLIRTILTVDDFIKSMYSQVDKCRYGNLRDEMIRERIVV